jgi:hypothetical protein
VLLFHGGLSPLPLVLGLVVCKIRLPQTLLLHRQEYLVVLFLQHHKREKDY